jgi:hypothetical protein
MIFVENISSITFTEMNVLQTSEIMFLERSDVSYFTYFELRVLQDMIDEFAVTAGCYGNGNVRGEKNAKVMRISKQPSPARIVIDQTQPENVEYFNYLSSVINDAICRGEIKSRIAMAKAAFNNMKPFFSPENWN